MDTPLSARAALLQALTVPGYGLDLIERVRRSSGGGILLRMGSVYPALASLESAGLVRHRAVGAPRRGRPRRYYELTVLGVSAALADRASVLGLLRGMTTSRAATDVEAMRKRLQACSDLSVAVLLLQRGVQEAKAKP